MVCAVFAVACVFSLICRLPDVVSVRLFVFHAFESAGVLAKTKLMHAFGFQSAGLAQAKAYELPQTVPTLRHSVPICTAGAELPGTTECIGSSVCMVGARERETERESFAHVRESKKAKKHFRSLLQCLAFLQRVCKGFLRQPQAFSRSLTGSQSSGTAQTN